MSAGVGMQWNVKQGADAGGRGGNGSVVERNAGRSEAGRGEAAEACRSEGRQGAVAERATVPEAEAEAESQVG